MPSLPPRDAREFFVPFFGFCGGEPFLSFPAVLNLDQCPLRPADRLGRLVCGRNPRSIGLRDPLLGGRDLANIDRSLAFSRGPLLGGL